MTLPGIRPTIVFMVLMTTIWSFLAFDYIWILTQGGPAGASEVLAALVYKDAFKLRGRLRRGHRPDDELFVGFVISIFIILRRRGWDI